MDSFRGEPVDLGRGYSIRFLFTGAELHCEWQPGMPKGRAGKRLLPAYRAARDRFVRDLADHHRISVMIVEV